MRNAAAKFLFCLSLGLVGPTAWCKTKNQIINNANLSVSITDLEDNYFVTGTGVNLIGGVSATIEQNNPDTTWNRIEIHELKLEAGAAGSGNLYPLPGVTPPIVAGKGGAPGPASLSRRARFDSTVAGGSVSGAPMAITVRAQFVLRKVNILPLPIPQEGPPQIIDLRPPLTQSVEVTVTVKAVNSLLVNSTSRIVSGPPAMDVPTIPPEYSWGTVSPQMAAAGKAGMSNHAALPGDRHTRAAILAIDKFPLATAWMNSYHGNINGVSADRADPSATFDNISWNEVANRIGQSNASASRSLQLNTVLLYSCECSLYNGLANTLFGPPINQVAFAFSEVVYTMLKPGDTTPEIPLTDANGQLLLTGKLTSHVTALTGELMAGTTAAFAAAKANEDYPPRTYSRRMPSNPAINLMGRLDITIKGDSAAPAKGVYKPEPVSTYVGYGSYLIVFK